MRKLIYILFLFVGVAHSQSLIDMQLLAYQQANATPSYDTDAQAYFDAATGLDLTEKDGWNTFVLSAKSNGYYSKLVAFYPLRGVNSTDMKYNAIDPLNYNITWTGAGTFNSTGYYAGSTANWGNTNWSPATDGDSSSFSYGMYLDGDYNDAGSAVGVTESGTGEWIALFPRSGGKVYSYLGSNSISVNGAVADSEGLYVVTETTGTSHKVFKDGTQIGSTEVSDNTATFDAITNTMSIGGRPYNNAASLTLAQTTVIYFIGDGLTDTDVANLTTDINQLITDWGL